MYFRLLLVLHRNKRRKFQRYERYINDNNTQSERDGTIHTSSYSHHRTSGGYESILAAPMSACRDFGFVILKTYNAPSIIIK
jgi:hypothetical protein